MRKHPPEYYILQCEWVTATLLVLDKLEPDQRSWDLVKRMLKLAQKQSRELFLEAHYGKYKRRCERRLRKFATPVKSRGEA